MKILKFFYFNFPVDAALILTSFFKPAQNPERGVKESLDTAFEKQGTDQWRAQPRGRKRPKRPASQSWRLANQVSTREELTSSSLLRPHPSVQGWGNHSLMGDFQDGKPPIGLFRTRSGSPKGSLGDPCRAGEIRPLMLPLAGDFPGDRMNFPHSTRTLCLLTLATGAAWGMASASGNPAARCPESLEGEKPRDCPWAEVGRELAKAASDGKSPLSVLAKRLPSFYSKLIVDSHQGSWLGLWGSSINFDEGARAVILAPAIIESLERLFGVPVGPRPGHIVHAGIEHTYGYLFSLVGTPFGFKRERWVEPTLDKGFHFPEGTICPLPREGSLFTNVTYWIGRIAFRREPDKLEILESDRSAAAAAVRDFPYSRLATTRIEETVEVPGGPTPAGGFTKSRVVRIRTDLVPFPQPVADNFETHLLVYSVDDPAEGGAKLITAFPVRASFVEKITASSLMGDSRWVTTRYNGYVEGVTGRQLSGRRQVIRP